MGKPSVVKDVVKKIDFWSASREQDVLRSAIHKKYRGAIPAHICWLNGTDKALGGLPADPVEQYAQRVYLSQIGNFFAHRMHWRRVWILFPALLVIGLSLSYVLFHLSGSVVGDTTIPLTLAVTVWLGLVLCLGFTVFAPLTAQIFLPRTPVLQDEIDAVQSVMARCVVRDIAPDTPPDLADRPRLLVTDSQGRSVAGQVLASDFEYSAVRAEWIETKQFLLRAGIAVLAPAMLVASPWSVIPLYFLVLFFFSLFDTQQGPDSFWWPFVQWIAIPAGLVALLSWGTASYFDPSQPMRAELVAGGVVALVWAALFVSILRCDSPLSARAAMLERAVRESGTELLIDKAGIAHFQQLENARIAQIRHATEAKSPFIPLGASTGLFAQRRDPLAPTEAGLPVGLSVADLSTHLAILGASGTGKTSGVIRPTVKAWIEAGMGGLLILDGKGALPLEFVGTARYRLISPAHGAFNPIAGMSPDAVADVLAEVFDDSQADKFWSDAARLMLRMAAILIAAHDHLPYTLGQIQRFCLAGKDDRIELMRPLAPLMTEGSLVQAAANYWLAELPQMPEKTAGSILNMVRTWLSNVCLHEKLGPWIDAAHSDIEIESVLTGGQLGLLLPESEYGSGGVAISTLCMRRLYDAVKRRGDNWRNMAGQTPVLLAADEVQNLLTKADLETVPVARSLGLYLMFATQNVDGLYKRLSREGAVQMLGNLASLVAFAPRTEDSNAYISHRAGCVWKAQTNAFAGLPDAASDIGLYRNSGLDQHLQSIAYFRKKRLGAPRLSYAIGLWHQEGASKAEELLNNLSMVTDQYQPAAKPSISLDLSPLVVATEIDTLLAAPGTALALLNRGRVQRRDLICVGGVV